MDYRFADKHPGNCLEVQVEQRWPEKPKIYSVRAEWVHSVNEDLKDLEVFVDQLKEI